MILQIIEKFSDIVKYYEIKKFKNVGVFYELVLQIYLIDKTILCVKDYLFSGNIRKYSYHWQCVKGECIIRWDNVPHHLNVTTFPFHKHIGVKEDVVDSEVMNLEKVLELLRTEIFKAKTDV